MLGRNRARALVERFPPPIALAILYLTVIALGTLLLALPVARTEPVALIDTLFISASAVTVTGLVTVDPGTVYTIFGEAVLMVLMQVGGLGLMAFAVLLLLTLGVRVGLPSRVVMSEELSAPTFKALTALARLVLIVALAVEGATTVLLTIVFVPDLGFWLGLWSALFHAVSAFNNAGFSLFANSLMDYAGHPIVVTVVPLAFIIGGLGFVVLSDLWRTRSWRELTLHSKLMLSGTVVLMLAAWLLFAAMEWANPQTLGALEGSGAKIGAAFFSATTPRTAGFNVVDTAALRDSTTLLTMVLMFIGGGPTSTAGGIKVTTAIVVVLAAIAFFKRNETLNVFGRSVDLRSVLEVMALTAISTALVVTSLFLLLIWQDGDFKEIMFEAVSAFGTVGLSQGVTSHLTLPGKIAIVVLMFLGRVGPLTLGFVLASRTGQLVHYPKGKVYMG